MDKNKIVNICFIRHGETDQNKAKKIQGRHDFPLNNNGRTQALITGRYLLNHDYHFDVIYSSPLSRAYETALIIKKEMNYSNEIIKEDSFIEREFGEAEGLDVSLESFKRVLDDSYNNMEKSFEIQKRVLDGVMNIINNTDYTNILIVAHSHTIKALLTSLDKNRTFYDPMVNCAINNFIYKNNELQLGIVNINPSK